MTKPYRWGLRILSIALCALCLVSVFRGGVAVEAEENETVMTTVIRHKASYSATVIGQMTDGTEVAVLGSSREFYKVDCYDMKGYIAKSQIEHTEDGKYYVNCNADSGETETMELTDHSEALTLRHDLRALAKKQLGSRYVRGASRPGAFDCSGLTQYLYKKHGINLYRNATGQLQDGVVVAKEGMQVGDLVFFKEGSGITSHVGIYVGNNCIIHASTKGVEVANLDETYYAKYYLCARRVINTGAARLDDAPVARTADGILSVNSISGRTAR